jgi:hypothetical protein
MLTGRDALPSHRGPARGGQGPGQRGQEVALAPAGLHEGVDIWQGSKGRAAHLARLRLVMWEDVGVVLMRSGLDQDASELFNIRVTTNRLWEAARGSVGGGGEGGSGAA